MRRLYQNMVEYGPNSFASCLLFCGLWPVSCCFRLIVFLRKLLFRLNFKSVYHASVPVISVGNITAGGTGKTPMVDLLAKYFCDKGIKPAIVSRGYGGSYIGTVGKVNDNDGALLMSAVESGDEPHLLAKRNPKVPVFVARRRRNGVVAAEKSGAELIILDDAFQHLAVHRDSDIVLLDSSHPLGNGFLLPAGPLREPVEALKRGHLFIRTRSDKGLNPDFPQVDSLLTCKHSLSDELISLDGKKIPWDRLKNKKCVAFAGIARPQDFFALLHNKGLALAETIALNDHQDYSPKTLSRLKQACENIDFLITTEKDAVKLTDVEFPIPCYQTPLSLSFEDIEPLEAALDCLIRRTDDDTL